MPGSPKLRKLWLRRSRLSTNSASSRATCFLRRLSARRHRIAASSRPSTAARTEPSHGPDAGASRHGFPTTSNTAGPSKTCLCVTNSSNIGRKRAGVVFDAPARLALSGRENADLQNWQERVAIVRFCSGREMTDEQAQLIVQEQMGLSDEKAALLANAEKKSRP